MRSRENWVMVHFRSSLLTVRLFIAVASISAIEWLADLALHQWAPAALEAAEGVTRLLHGAVLFVVVWFLARKLSGLVDDVSAQRWLQTRLADLSRVSLENRNLGDVE